jgi:hypothetical protein
MIDAGAKQTTANKQVSERLRIEQTLAKKQVGERKGERAEKWRRNKNRNDIEYEW